MNKFIPIAVIIAIVFAAAGFYGGMQYGSSKNSSKFPMTGNRQGGIGGATANGGSIAYGSIVSVDSTSMTVKMNNGGSKIVFFSSSTKISKNADALASDLAAGQTVMASGTSNSDGSISAVAIQINPQAQMNLQNSQSNSDGTKSNTAKTQTASDGGSEVPPMDFNGAGGPPPGM